MAYGSIYLVAKRYNSNGEMISRTPFDVVDPVDENSFDPWHKFVTATSGGTAIENAQLEIDYLIVINHSVVDVTLTCKFGAVGTTDVVIPAATARKSPGFTVLLNVDQEEDVVLTSPGEDAECEIFVFSTPSE